MSIPESKLSVKIIDLINDVLLLLNKKDQLFKYMQLKEKLIKNTNEKIEFWNFNINLFKNNGDEVNQAKSALNLALIAPENEDFFYDFEELKHIINEKEFLQKIIDLYFIRAEVCDDEYEKGDLYFKIFKIAKSLDNKDISYQALKKGLKEAPKHVALKLAYKKWIDEKKIY
jgi:hypothetical protein